MILMDRLNYMTVRFSEIVSGLLIDQESFPLCFSVIVRRLLIQVAFF